MNEGIYLAKCPKCKLSLYYKDIKHLEIEDDVWFRYVLCPRCGFRKELNNG